MLDLKCIIRVREHISKEYCNDFGRTLEKSRNVKLSANGARIFGLEVRQNI